MSNPISNRAPAVSAERVRLYVRSRFNPIRSLTPELLSQYLDAFKTGYLRQCALIWDAIEERDDTLASVIPKRKAAAARHGWEILIVDSIAESLKTQANAHKQCLENFYNNLTCVNSVDENERGEVGLLCRQMMDAVGKRYAVHEIIWKPGVAPAPTYSQTPTPTHSSSVSFGLTAELRFAPLWFFEHTTGRLRFLPNEGAIEGVPMDDQSWMISVAPGLMPACSVAYMYKTMSLRDWVIYCERHGMPGIHGKTDAAKGSDEWDTMVEAVQNFASEWAMVTNSSGMIEKIDMATSGQLPYPPLVERMDRAMAAIWRGADLSTMSGQTSEAGQGASLQGDESAILEQDDCQWLSETLSRNLDRRVLEYYYGAGVKPLAYIKIKTAQRKNIDQELKIDETLHRMGAPIAVDSLLERFSRPQPDPGDPLLPASAPAINPFADAGPSAGGRLPPTAVRLRQLQAPRSPASATFPNSLEGERPREPFRSATGPDAPAVGQMLAGLRDAMISAQDKTLAPIRAELQRVLAAPAADLPAEIAKLKTRLPELLRQINVDPETSKIIEAALTAGFVEGMQ